MHAMPAYNAGVAALPLVHRGVSCVFASQFVHYDSQYAPLRTRVRRIPG